MFFRHFCPLLHPSSKTFYRSVRVCFLKIPSDGLGSMFTRPTTIPSATGCTLLVNIRVNISYSSSSVTLFYYYIFTLDVVSENMKRHGCMLIGMFFFFSDGHDGRVLQRFASGPATHPGRARAAVFHRARGVRAGVRQGQPTRGHVV